MSKSRYDNELDQMTARALRAENEAAQLRDMLKSMVENAQARGAGSTGEIVELQGQRDKWRQRAEAAETTLDAFFQRYGQLELAINPSAYVDIGEVMKTVGAQVESGEALRVTTRTAPLQVAYMIVGRSDVTETVYVFEGTGMFLGSVSNFQQEVGRIDALIWRAPLPEDLRSPYLDRYGISLESQLSAIQDVSVFWHDDLLRDQLSDKLEQIFNAKLRTDCNPNEISAARDDFRRSVQNTFQAMSNKRSTRKDKPLLRSGKSRDKP